MLPTTAPIVDIELGGRTRKLYFGFRAWKILGVNPMKPADLQKFLDEIDPQKAAEWIYAGLQGHVALVRALAREDGQPEPEIQEIDLETVLDFLDAETFTSIVAAISGQNPEPEAQPEANPQ